MKLNVTEQAYFRQNTQGVYVGNDPARGPWSANHCHAGPVSGLIARAAEIEVGPDKMLTRLTVDLLRPLPLSGLRVAAETMRHTKTLATMRVTVHDLEDSLCAAATTMHMVRRNLGDVPNVEIQGPRLDDVVEGPFPIGAVRHDLPGFVEHSEIAYPSSGNQAAGPKTVWMRTPPLLNDENPSPIQALCPLADCGNGISWNAPTTEMGFMNSDLTVQIHREPVSSWLASESISHWQPTGIGMSQSVLYDTQGPVGTALQTLILFPSG